MINYSNGKNDKNRYTHIIIFKSRDEKTLKGFGSPQ